MTALNGITNTLILPIGIAGSGKSTFINGLINKYRSKGETCEKVSADDFPDLYSERGEIDKTKLDKAHTYCLRTVLGHMEKHVKNIFVDNTNLNVEKWYEYMILACNNGYQVYLMLPDYGLTFYNTGITDLGEQIDYIKNIRATIQDASKPKVVPANIIEKMYRDFVLVKKFINQHKQDCDIDPHEWIKLCC